ncbi:MAG: DUF1080 domain-containing protein [Saprospiraceae bacterium]
MKNLLLLSILLYSAFLTAQITDPKATEVWEPEPRKVTGSLNYAPPSDAIVLFDGESAKHWQHDDGSAVKWTVANGIMTVNKGTGQIRTKEKFGDCQLHLEWRSPQVIEGEGQGRGNSGVFLQGRYEVQILDSYNNRTYSNGQAGSIYKQHIPLVNAMNPTGEWQAYDIIFTAPRFNEDGMRVAPGYITVLHNGVLIQNHVEIKGTSEYIGLPKNIAHEEDVIILQDHSNPVSFRNIWLRKL